MPEKCYVLRETYFGSGTWDDEDDIQITGVYLDKQDAVNAAYNLDYQDGFPKSNHLTEIIEVPFHPRTTC